MRTLLSLFVFAITLLTASAQTPSVPVRWLEGVRGYQKALELQKATKKPILIWTTQSGCGNCANVTLFLNKPNPKKALKEYIRVILDDSGQKAEAAFCKENRFNAGYFYILPPAENPTPSDKVWAWKPDSRVIIDGLDETLATKLAAQKQP